MQHMPPALRLQTHPNGAPESALRPPPLRMQSMRQEVRRPVQSYPASLRA